MIGKHPLHEARREGWQTNGDSSSPKLPISVTDMVILLSLNHWLSLFGLPFGT